MMIDTNMGIRYIHNGHPAYANIRGVISARQNIVRGVISARQNISKHLVFLELANRDLLEEREATATVLAPSRATIFVEMLTTITHIVKFVPATPAPPDEPSTEGQYFCLRIWSTTPGWELK
jgi:hypothetical protein